MPLDSIYIRLWASTKTRYSTGVASSIRVAIAHLLLASHLPNYSAKYRIPGTMLSRTVSLSTVTSSLLAASRQRQKMVAPRIVSVMGSSWWVDLRDALPSSPSGSIRMKHSETQVKRLFKNHPARKRVENRRGVDRTVVLDPPTFQPILEPTFLPNGWTPPPLEDVTVPEYPFRVARTGSKPNGAVGFLPVYSNYRINGGKATTRIKKVTGDRDLFLKELRSVLNLPSPKNQNPRDDAIRVRVGGTIEVNGNRVHEVRMWLAGLGF